MTDDPIRRPPLPRRPPGQQWWQRTNAAQPLGVRLEPIADSARGRNATQSTGYAPHHLLVTGSDELERIYEVLNEAAVAFGWSVEIRTLEGEPVESVDERAAVQEEARGYRSSGRVPPLYRASIVADPKPDVDDEPVAVIDAWRLLRAARERDLPRRVGLDHVLSVGPFPKTNPFTRTNPFPKTNPFPRTNAPGPDNYAEPGSGGREVVGFVGAAPAAPEVAEGGRRPVVAVLDTGCGSHPWLEGHVRHDPVLPQWSIGRTDAATDPEVFGDQVGPYDGFLDDAAGHGTFIGGIIRQRCPAAEIVAIRVADSEGLCLEGEFLESMRRLVEWIRGDHGAPEPVDVLNLSLGYYHETPRDVAFDDTMSVLLADARVLGCAVVCSAGNDSTDRPAFPAALWRYAGADYEVTEPDDAAPHVSVGALNPDNRTVALFSNIGGWVKTYAPGASVLSTTPAFQGAVQAGTHDDVTVAGELLSRATIDPDDFTGGFAVWSGTSFAAPYVAGAIANHIAAALLAGKAPSKASERSRDLREAADAVEKALTLRDSAA